MLMESHLEQIVNSRTCDALCELYKEQNDLRELRKETKQLSSQIHKNTPYSPELHQLILKRSKLNKRLREARFKKLYFQGYKDCMYFLDAVGMLKK